MKCPICGNTSNYVGFNTVECNETSCTNYKQPPKINVKARVYWRIHGLYGTSRLLDLETAETRAKEGNRKHGSGTHWIVKDGEGDSIYNEYIS